MSAPNRRFPLRRLTKNVESHTRRSSSRTLILLADYAPFLDRSLIDSRQRMAEPQQRDTVDACDQRFLEHPQTRTMSLPVQLRSFWAMTTAGDQRLPINSTPDSWSMSKSLSAAFTKIHGRAENIHHTQCPLASVKNARCQIYSSIRQPLELPQVRNTVT